MSTLERKTYYFLESENIEFEFQYRFDDCRLKNPLPFDFYLPSYNIAIECQGQQHFMSSTIFGGENDIEYQQERDKIKKDYCRDNNIKLVAIPWWRFNKDAYKDDILNIINNIS